MRLVSWRFAVLAALIFLSARCLLAQANAPATTNDSAPGSISGSVADTTGAAIAQARVRLKQHNGSFLETGSISDGRFFFPRVVAGSFEITVSASGFATQIVSGTVNSGQVAEVPEIRLAVGTAITDIRVSETQEEIAEDQIKEQEQQRILGVIPNFYVTYLSNAAPLVPRQKFKLAWKTLVDPSAFVITGFIAGVEQATDTYGGYGQGAQGYAKRYGAAYADFVSGTMFTGAIFPSLFKQDPRYFYKGTGSVRQRIDYALANAVICKGDNGHWQANYSSILGNLAAGGISNLYYPAQDRNGAALTFENAAIGIAASAGANIIQEFVIPRLTPHKPKSPTGASSQKP
ncbi:MAG: carboxypeptidase-like regulatory domain-containing protein [Terriglobales bacterium]|jgi:hypothetical protein